MTTLAPTPPVADGAACAVMLICVRRSASASVRAQIVKVTKGASIRAQIEVKMAHSAWIRAQKDTSVRCILQVLTFRFESETSWSQINICDMKLP